jgi:16S rRNA (adenine1518-N6/adenine1519-N6)-dimethyltransferase
MTTRTTSRADRRPPRRRFGQHFLEPAWVARVVAAIAPAADDTILEIGPGRGALTRPLAERAGRVIAVEIDRDLAAALPDAMPPNVRVVTGDVLAIDVEELLHGEPRSVRVAGNLPYNVSSPILFQLVRSADEGRRLRDATLMLQQEVADRLVATPGTSGYGVLALQVGLSADVQRLFTLPPGAFRPPPAVTSALVRLQFRPPAQAVDPAVFERVVRGMFLQRRKTLLNALAPVAATFGRSAAELLAAAGIDARRRPETLSLADVARLVRAVL